MRTSELDLPNLERAYTGRCINGGRGGTAMFAARRLLVVASGFFLALQAVGAQDIAEKNPPDERLAPVIAALKAEEAKFREIEYSIQIGLRKLDPKVAGEGEIVSEE